MNEKIAWLLSVITGEAWQPRYDSEGNCFMWLRVRNEKLPPKAGASHD